MGKEEIVHYEQFLFFPLCFQKVCTAKTQKQGLVWAGVSTVLSNKILDWSKLKALADDKINMTEKVNFFWGGKVDNIVGKRENAGYIPAFSLSPTIFSKGFFYKVIKSLHFVVKG